MLLECATRLEISFAGSVGALEALQPEWNRLWQCDLNATPFQSPAWLLPWARHFTNGTLSCVAVREVGRLVALLPVFVWENQETFARELVLLGTGISDYCDALSAPGHAHAVNFALTQLRDLGTWDVLGFQELRPHSPLLSGSVEAQSVAPVIDFTTGTADPLSVIPKQELQNLAYYRRRAERLGACVWETVGEASCDAMLDELFALHELRWRERGERGVLESVHTFHREAAFALLSIGVLRMYRLKLDGKTVAVFYGFVSHGRAYYYLSGFDPSFAGLSPGTLIVGHAIDQALREGCTRFDFLRGAERYKYLWGAKDTQTFRRIERRVSNVES